MNKLAIIIIFEIISTTLCILTFEWSMHGCIDYWSKRQYKLYKIICCVIGLSALIITISVYVYNSNLFLKEFKFFVLLAISSYLIMGLFSQTIRLIAWKKKTEILEHNIKETMLKNSKLFDTGKLLDICIYENRYHFSCKQIEKTFKKQLIKQQKFKLK